MQTNLWLFFFFLETPQRYYRPVATCHCHEHICKYLRWWYRPSIGRSFYDIRGGENDIQTNDIVNFNGLANFISYNMKLVDVFFCIYVDNTVLTFKFVQLEIFINP